MTQLYKEPIMQLDPVPDFMGLAKTAIEIFHPEVLNFPQETIDAAIEFKAQKLRESYEAMLADRRK